MIAEAQEAYSSALKQGQREFRACVANGRSPYPALLDEETAGVQLAGKEYPGLLEVPMERVVGMTQQSRLTAFSDGFMPLLSDETEFAAKWESLYRAHIEDGIRDAIKVYEFRNRYFVEEGNKRVSVLRYVGASHVMADVIRLLPPRNDEKENVIYYEYLDFARRTGVTDLYFSETGRFSRLLSNIDGAYTADPWPEGERMALRAGYQRFLSAFIRAFGKRAAVPVGDAFLLYVEICGYNTLRSESEEQIASNIDRMRTEFEAMGKDDTVRLSLDPTPIEDTPFISRILTVKPFDLKAAFLFEKTPTQSPWTAVHDAGRERMHRNLVGRVHTAPYYNVRVGENDDELIERAIAEGADVVFTTTPKLIGASVRAAVRHPEVRILNCSLNMRHPSIRTYYGRVYEVKFLIGAIAGALCENNRVGYLADYPIFGVPASINAFAKGVELSNPYARVQLEWTGLRGGDPYAAFRKNGVTVISGRDLRAMESADQAFGLYRDTGDGAEWLALPYWHWGKFYTEIGASILNGTWKADGGEDEETVNYWWGLSSGVLDVACSNTLPGGTLRLIQILRDAILADRLDPLAPYHNAYHSLLSQEEEMTGMSPERILCMDTLAGNIDGRIPMLDELIEEARPLVRLQGVHSPEAQHG